MNYVYILYSKKDKKFYTGKTSNLLVRLEKHIKGQVGSTKNRRPLVLVHCEVFKTGGEAFLREKELKYPSAGKLKSELRKRLVL